MTRWAWLPLVLTVGACAPKLPPAASIAPPAAVCRIGPDGGRPIADRGIGGTGAPATQVTDRGIGGTGIIGVITGFASVCLAGQEVALPPDIPALIDGQPGRLDDLRAGQLIALEARGAPGSLQAQRIMVQHAVIGRVETVGRGTMTVAGQFVFIADATGTAAGAQIGDWVAVSGLQQTENTIVATRFDPSPAGQVLVRGPLIRTYGAMRIGSLRVRLPNGSMPPAGFPVVAAGHMDGDVLVVDRIARDIAAESPSAYFGPTVSSFVIESYVAVVPGGYLVNRDFVAGSGFSGVGSRGRGIASFTRGEGGGFVATGLRLGSGADGSGNGFAPAPMPRAGFGGDRPRSGGQTDGFTPRNGRGGYGPGPFGAGSSGGGQDGAGFQGQPGQFRH